MPSAVDRVDIGARRDRCGGQRIDVAAILRHGQLAVDELLRFEFPALDARKQDVALVGHLGTETRSLGLLQHVDVHYFALGREAHHQAHHAAEALLGHRLHGITAHAAPGRRRVNRDRHVVDGQLLGRRGVERREHLVQGRQRRGFLGRRDRLHGNHIDEAHSGRSHEGDAEEDGRHVQKCTFHAVTSSYFTPKRLGLTYLLIRGTQAFIIRIANDMPSG